MDAFQILDHQHAEDFAVRVERPDVSLLVIFLLREAPVANGAVRAVAALAEGLMQLVALQRGVAAARHGVVGLFSGADVGPHDAVGAKIQRLFGEMLVHFRAIGRNAHDGRHRRRKRTALHYLVAVQQVLQRVADVRAVPHVVFSLEHDAVVLRALNGDGRFGRCRRKCCEGGLTRFEGADHAIQSVSHGFLFCQAFVPVAAKARDGIGVGFLKAPRIASFVRGALVYSEGDQIRPRFLSSGSRREYTLRAFISKIFFLSSALTARPSM